eukprot:gene68573-93963_t
MFLISAPLGQWFGGVVIDRLYARGVSAPSNVLLAICSTAAVLPALPRRPLQLPSIEVDAVTHRIDLDGRQLQRA